MYFIFIKKEQIQRIKMQLSAYILCLLKQIINCF